MEPCYHLEYEQVEADEAVDGVPFFLQCVSCGLRLRPELTEDGRVERLSFENL